jgi:hypothetical protein
MEPTTPALEGKVHRKQVAISPTGHADGPWVNVLMYLPAKATTAVPVFLGLNFYGNQTVQHDPAIHLPTSWVRNNAAKQTRDNRATEESRGRSAGRWPVETIVARGYGLVTVYYGDIDPDFDDGFQNGVHAQLQPEPRRPDDWGSIATWAFGLSRVLDALEQEPEVDATRVSVFGHSRLGKTSLWAGAEDPRFALVISNNSGCGGAALSRRRSGETVARINQVFPHWFCKNFRRYNDREHELPVDQHMLLALMAPRPVYVASAMEDKWADPEGEFLSAVGAGPVYELLGEHGLGTERWPEPGTAIHQTVGYHVRPGKHDVTDFDWQQFLDFADRHLQ